jgi:hypothetical protein
MRRMSILGILLMLISQLLFAVDKPLKTSDFQSKVGEYECASELLIEELTSKKRQVWLLIDEINDFIDMNTDEKAIIVKQSGFTNSHEYHSDLSMKIRAIRKENVDISLCVGSLYLKKSELQNNTPVFEAIKYKKRFSCRDVKVLCAGVHY